MKNEARKLMVSSYKNETVKHLANLKNRLNKGKKDPANKVRSLNWDLIARDQSYTDSFMNSGMPEAKYSWENLLESKN